MVKNGLIRILDALLATILMFVLFQATFHEIYLNKQQSKIFAVKQSYKSCTDLIKDLHRIFGNSNIYVYNLTNNQLVCSDTKLYDLEKFSEINIERFLTKINYTLVFVKVVHVS